jgi:glycosyltransferase involved in cell wall biosynthesis
MARVLHLIPQLEEGGAQRLLSDVVAHSRKHTVEVAALISSPPEKLFPFFRNTAIPIHFLSDSLDFYHPRLLPSIRRLIKEQRYDLVQCWMYEAIVQGVASCRTEGVPCLIFPQSMRIMLKLNRHRMWERFLVSKFMSLADRAIFPSYSTALDYLNAGWVKIDRIRVARGGVDCTHFQPLERGDAIVAVGRPSAEKGFDFMERVVSRLRSFFPKLRCLVAGGGSRPASSQLEYVGYLDDVRPLYRQAALYISTSLTEALSLALLESQAMGVPGVIRKIGSNSEVIQHGLNGFLADSEDEYVGYCKMLLEDPELRSSMSAKSREVAITRFAIEKQVDEIESVHDELA